MDEPYEEFNPQKKNSKCKELGKRLHAQIVQPAQKNEGSTWLRDQTKCNNNNQVTMHESTKLTCSLILNSSSRRTNVAQPLHAQQFYGAMFEADDEEALSSGDFRRFVQDSIVPGGNSRKCNNINNATCTYKVQLASDETLIYHLHKNSCATNMMKQGVSYRRFRSLQFRKKRRIIKTKLSGDPFKLRKAIKNSNRQTAA